MKILLLNVSSYGSTGRICRGIVKLANAAGHDARLFFGRGDVPEDVPALRTAPLGSVGVHALLSRVTDRAGFYGARDTRLLTADIDAFNPDVIHLNNLHGYWLDVAALFPYLAKAGRPVVWTLHDCWAFTGHCPYFSFAACERWRTGCGHCPQKSSIYPVSRVLDQSRRNLAEKKRLFSAVPNMTLVTPSEWLAGLVHQTYLDRYPLRVLQNGVDRTTFRPTQSDVRARFGIGADEKLLLGVSNVWEPRKGLDAFLRLAGELPAGWRIALVGLNARQLSNLPAGVVGVCRTENAAALAGWYTAADVFLNPTTEDNFPTTNIEALACGTPVVTYAAGGSAEMLDDTCGVAVPVGDFDALIPAVRRALGMPGEACVRRAANYDETERLGAYLALYGALAREGGQ